MENFLQELQQLKEDMRSIQDKFADSYDKVLQDLHEKEVILKQLYEHNVKLVKEKEKCDKRR